MAYNLKLLKNFSLRARVLNEVAKICWGDFKSDFPYEERNDYDDLFNEELWNLLCHRIRVCDQISEIAFTLPKTLGSDLNIAVLYLQRGYTEAIVCAGMYRYVGNFVPLNPLGAGPYAAKNFIDPKGYFNELFWAERFVSEENISVFSRFELACYYCFEEVIINFWYSFKESGNHPYEKSFDVLRDRFGFFVAIWIYRLDDKFVSLAEENELYLLGFYVNGFEYALSSGNEYAARFFWDGFSDADKDIFLNGIYEWEPEDLSSISFRECAGCVDFIYSLLSVDHKRIYFTNPNFDNPIDFSLVYCLLLSPFYKSVLNDLLTLSNPLKQNTFQRLLESLALRIKSLPIPEYKESFKALWESLSHRAKIGFLEMESQIIENFSAIRATDLLQIIIQPLPHSMKKIMLIEDWQSAGISALDLYSSFCDFNELRRYLLFFLINIDPVTQKRSVGDDAFQLLYEFFNGDMFVQWINEPLPKYEKEGVLRVVDNLQGSLLAIKYLLK